MTPASPRDRAYGDEDIPAKLRREPILVLAHTGAGILHSLGIRDVVRPALVHRYGCAAGRERSSGVHRARPITRRTQPRAARAVLATIRDTRQNRHRADLVERAYL